MKPGSLYAELMKTVERTIGQEHRFTERRDPAHRPPGAVPVEFVLLGYPVLDSPPLPGDSGDSGDDGGDSDSEAAIRTPVPGADAPVPDPRKCQSPSA